MKWPWCGNVSKGHIPDASWMARSGTQESAGPEKKVQQGWAQDTTVRDIYLLYR